MKKLTAFIAMLIAMFAALPAMAQNKTVTGKVTDQRDGTGMAGVTILVKGQKTGGTFTKEDGTYSITLPANGGSVLVFSAVGFAKQEVNVAGKGTADVSLAITATQQAEAVVIGYGSLKRKDVTGSIVKVDGNKIAGVPAPSFESALAGKAAGVQVTTAGGMAGSGAIITIRGAASISTAGDPLYVIDGIPMDFTYQGNTRNQLAQDRNPLANINPNDIESVEILKDAAAAGIYGSRGANGVILITTKRGKGKGKITFNNSVGVVTPSLRPKFVDKNTWLALRQEAWELDGNTGPQQNLPGRNGGFNLNEALNSAGTDWWDLGTQVGINHEHTLAYTRGGNKLSSYIGGTYGTSESYAIGSKNARIGIRGNFDYKPTKNLTISTNLAWYGSRTDMTNNNWNGGLSYYMGTALPYYPVFNANGTYFRTQGAGLTWTFGDNNPELQRNNSSYRNNEDRVITGGTITYKPIRNLTLTSTVTNERNNSNFNSYRNSVFINRTDGVSGNGNYYLSRYNNYQFNFTAQYNWEINKDNRVNFLAGGEYQDQSTQGKDIYYDTLQKPFPQDKPNGFKDQLDNQKFVTTYQRLFRSYFARINYNYKEKLTLQASARRDASSVFRENYRAAIFPTVSAGWVISKESFMENVNFINYLKLRAGWGLVGNANIPWNAGYSNVDITRPVGSNYGGQPSIYQTSLGNPDLRWETSDNIDAAIEFGFFNNRISGELGVYRKVSKDLLLQPPISFYNGVGANLWQNTGKLLNQGIEFTINTVNIKKKDFSWTSNFNIAHNYNEVLDLGGLLPDAIGGGTNETRVLPGYPVGTIFTVRYHGVDPADGLPIFLDRNGNKTKTLNVAALNGDKVPVANVYPKVSGGFTNTFKYKQFELSALFTYQFGGHIWDNSGKRNMGYITDWNIYSHYVGNYWRKPGDEAKYPRPTLKGYPGVEGNPWSNNSSIQVHSSDFVRLREASIGYNLPSKLMKRIKATSGKVFLSGFNLLVFTKYPVGDPEVARDADSQDASARNQSYNANFLTLPQARVVNFGINLTF
jgi:TonB-dependent starch-binding outer membrane protein SusC